MPPIQELPIDNPGEGVDVYADADDLPIGESDTYLVSMVAAVEAEPKIEPKAIYKTSIEESPEPGKQLSRRALLLNGEA